MRLTLPSALCAMLFDVIQFENTGPFGSSLLLSPMFFPAPPVTPTPA